VPVVNESTMILGVLVPRGNVKAGTPDMRIVITSLMEQRNRLTGSTIVLPEPHGDPPVQCDLNAAQADWVRTNGIPESLIEAMRKAAKDENWKPLDLNGDDKYFPSVISVPADLHFPK
jgi:hypothetical protein